MVLYCHCPTINGKKTFVYFLVFFCLFFPSRYVVTYQLSLLFLISFGILLHGANFKIPTVLVAIFTLVLVSSYSGIFFHGNDAVRDFSEVLRFLVPLFFIFYFRNFSGKKVLCIVSNVLLVYSFSVFFVSLLQFFDIRHISVISDIYASPHHLIVSLNQNSRALGLSPGPGQNGAIMVVVAAFAIGQLLIGNVVSKSFLTFILSSAAIFLSQSQTSFLALLAIVLYSVFFGIVKLKGRKIVFRFSLIIFVLAVSFFLFFIEKLRYLSTLFTRGLERNSFQVRLEKTISLFNDSVDGFFPIIFGHGKSFYGEKSTSMDNEYLFFFGVYGLFFLAVLLWSYLYIIIRPWLLSASSIVSNEAFLSLSFICFSGVIMASVNIFILEFRVLMILSVIISSYVYYRDSERYFKNERAVSSFKRNASERSTGQRPIS